ncbi:MAG: 2-amino-4-hydroxy-6-hydroxymethyldihydropteridine diphosphokinase [Rhodospirillaceae bacterium]|jgi:2-amino-4-hydroxy-6-hydroxymethyldihydropteridine diphosphokinase|nr:2-amino-4-hydroxy-6-hydroxymethyldihydropteridine diphosphokinase [Rhodospirillaceae bacterium]MBT3628285.1 2-amino-4-hydroxy-6-hydroxymethyldihydropteridine diphosphokinase [Rhodospirillaceae bacterium]MBT3928738.1 2-amino-4-hydroxy-6-hydroxymethyldihydropteridine diphosphokinase [Rhodospirillaceae bacterium]MBT4427389.1 2-amino-4-hydroxy-6-hydroxymethyldihydropteridine diphosphokinase [Rhodospirillaceae bacterium]MBT5038105.1 2-amino-4-hydroxy-6-hydroxymethyldihydropteridine diphosphokinas
MIFIALGANLETERYGPPERGLQAALRRLQEMEANPGRRSSWYRSAPVPAASQPWFINGVAELDCHLSPAALMALLLSVEAEFGRRRSVPNAARVLDLDLIDFGGKILEKSADNDGPALQLPHPRLAERAFVLLPLAEIAPNWRHPINRRHIDDLIADLPPDQQIERIED